MMKYSILACIGVLVVSTQMPAQTTSPISAADSALEACVAAAEMENEAVAQAAAERAQKIYDALIRAKTQLTDALTGKARVLSQCRIPFASFLRKGALVDESNELAQRALALDSLHFDARYTLALNHYFTPEFLGRSDDAMRELEKLIALHGQQHIPPMSTVYLFLGDMYLRKDRKADALRIWRGGREQFPEDAAQFDARLAKVSGSKDADASGSVEAAPAAPMYEIDPLVVEAGRFSVDDARSGATLKRMDILTMPGGTADVLQVFQAMPGVTRATEGSDLYVRGGDPAEAPVFVDGARLSYAGAFETLHGGIFGVLDPNVIRKADFSSGGFSVRYGNALSGVLDVVTDGRPDARSWRAGVNLVSAGSSLRVPLGARTGFWASGRATETTALLWTQGKGDDYPTSPWSLNGMAGLAYEPVAGVEIKATALSESDEATRMIDVLGYSGALRSRGGTHMAALSARAVNPQATASLRASLMASLRSTDFELGVLDRERDDYSYALRVDGDVVKSRTLRWRSGLEAAAFDAREDGVIPTSAELAPGSPSRALNAASAQTTHLGGYLESEVTVTPRLAFITGARADRLPGADSWSVDPRLALAYRAGGWTLRTGAGVFQQGPWRIGYDVPSPGAPAGVPTRARHLVFGVERAEPLLLRVEAFAKSYDQYVQEAGVTSADDVVQGPMLDRGRVLGVDALVRWQASGALSGWASYSYLDARVRLRETSDWIRASTDVPHTLTAVTKLSFADSWEIGTTSRFGTGRPFTPITGVREENGQRFPVYGATHSARLPDYLRLDARLTRLIPSGSGIFVFYLEALNLLDRQNLMAYTYDSTYTRRLPVESFFADRTLVFGAEAHF